MSKLWNVTFQFALILWAMKLEYAAIMVLAQHQMYVLVIPDMLATNAKLLFASLFLLTRQMFVAIMELASVTTPVSVIEIMSEIIAKFLCATAFAQMYQHLAVAMVLVSKKTNARAKLAILDSSVKGMLVVESCSTHHLFVPTMVLVKDPMFVLVNLDIQVLLAVNTAVAANHSLMQLCAPAMVLV
jgi:hypothetical protein